MNSIKIILMALTTFLMSSCNLIFDLPFKEQNVVCDSNCYQLDLLGTVINKSTNRGIKDIPVTMKWYNTDYFCFLCKENILICKKTTDSNGSFTITNSIDTSYFHKHYALSIEIPEDTNYFAPNGYGHYVQQFKESDLKQMTIELYSKVKLKIVTERILTDSMDALDVQHYFRKDLIFPDRFNSRWRHPYYYPLNDTLDVVTSPFIKTYIRWTKYFNNASTSHLDSIICQTGQKNIYTIKY